MSLRWFVKLLTSYRSLLKTLQNLGLGVFEDRSHKTRERESESESESEDDTEDMSSLSDTSSSSSQSGILASNSTSRPKMPLPKRARPEIVVLDDHTTPR